MEKVNRCGQCGTEQQLVDITKFHCERCGTLNHSDGSMEQTLDNESQQRLEDFYDNRSGYRDR